MFILNVSYIRCEGFRDEKSVVEKTLKNGEDRRRTASPPYFIGVKPLRRSELANCGKFLALIIRKRENIVRIGVFFLKFAPALPIMAMYGLCPDVMRRELCAMINHD